MKESPPAAKELLAQHAVEPDKGESPESVEDEVRITGEKQKHGGTQVVFATIVEINFSLETLEASQSKFE